MGDLAHFTKIRQERTNKNLRSERKRRNGRERDPRKVMEGWFYGMLFILLISAHWQTIIHCTQKLQVDACRCKLSALS